jgi:putative transposase
MDAMLRGKAEELAKEIAVSISTQQELGDVMRLMTKSVIERMLDAEMDVHLGQEHNLATAKTASITADANPDPGERSPRRNRRNGASGKTVQGESGQLNITTPRDRNGTFEPLLIPKYERRLAGFDDKVLALYATPDTKICTGPSRGADRAGVRGDGVFGVGERESTKFPWTVLNFGNVSRRDNRQ